MMLLKSYQGRPIFLHLDVPKTGCEYGQGHPVDRIVSL